MAPLGPFLVVFCQRYLYVSKTDIQTVILMCLMGQNLNWLKSYDTKCTLKLQRILAKSEIDHWSDIWPFYNHLWPFLCKSHEIFHKTEIQMVILRCLVCLNLNWIKSYDIINGWNKFFHAWKYRSKFLHLRRKTAVIFPIWLFF